MADDQDSRTEDPTGKRLGQARERGQVGMSRDLSTAASLIAATVVFLLVLPWSMQPLFRLLRGLIAHPDQVRIGSLPDLQHLGGDLMATMAWSLAMPIAVLVIAGVATSIAQTEGLLWSTQKLTP